MKSFLELQATQTGFCLIEEVYGLCNRLPKEEMYGISSQVKRASNSIVANIAKGFGRYTYADKAHKYTISRGECCEVVAFLDIIVRLKFLNIHDVSKALFFADQTGRLLTGLIQSSKARSVAKS